MTDSPYDYESDYSDDENDAFNQMQSRLADGKCQYEYDTDNEMDDAHGGANKGKKCLHRGPGKHGPNTGHCMDYGGKKRVNKGIRFCAHHDIVNGRRHCAEWQRYDGKMIRHRGVHKLTKKGMVRKSNAWNMYFAKVKKAVNKAGHDLPIKVIASYYDKGHGLTADEAIRTALGSGLQGEYSNAGYVNAGSNAGGLVGGRIRRRKVHYRRGGDIPLNF